MSDASSSRQPRGGGADPTASQAGLLRQLLRQVFGGRSEASWRATIEELIEENGEVAEGEGDDVDLAAHERLLLANILRLRELTVYDIMVPRADIVAIDIDTPLPDALGKLARKAHSRVPIYRDTLDEIVGVVHMKDLLIHIADSYAAQPAETSGEAEGEPPPPGAALVAALERARDLRPFVRDVLIVAPSMRVLDLLLEMRQRRQHLALVVDEFGGIDGMATIEDLIEQIIGEIDDEHDEETAPQLIERPDGSFVADARLPIEVFEERFGPVLDEDERDDIDTLGGLVYAIAGRIPARGELVRHPAGFEIEVADADSRRIRRLRVRRDPEAAEGGDAG